ncbi:MAG: RcpC/CpaB family pilus assembly protein [Elusimicrobia bacterium]|nr:RcpC/CpaB family pilus assembly protein [Elusimicrobiota bacterium]
MTGKRISSATLLAALVVFGLTWLRAQDKKEPAPAEKPAARAQGRLRQSLLARLFDRGFDRRLMADRYRAVAVPVNEYGLTDLRPGDRVDVLTVFDALAPDNRKEKLAATLLQNVKVLGVDLSADRKGPGTLHLLLNPLEAQYAALAACQGELFVALRKEGDVEIYPMEMASFRKLFR